MRLFRAFLTVLLLLFLTNASVAQNFTTYTYFTNNSIQLELDLFLPQSAEKKQIPLVIYVHGGGFSSGSRANGHALAKYLQQHNIACASISYTLFMKGKSFGCNGILSEKKMAIQMVSNEIWQATDFLLNDELNNAIDPQKVFLAGSSAGAEAVMHATYWNRNTMQLYPNHLSDDFSYAGVISGAGALLDIQLITKENAIPLLAFHGNKDNLVPYATAPHHFCPEKSTGYMMFYGSKTMAQKLQQLRTSVHLITYDGGGHEFCGELFFRNQEPIIRFVSLVVKDHYFEQFETVLVPAKGK